MSNVNTVQNSRYIQTMPVDTTVKSSEYTNSILENQSTNQEEVKKQSNLDKLLENLCSDFAQYGLTANQLKNSGILYRISGLNEQQIETADDAKLKQIIECLKEGLKNSIVDGKIDLEKAGSLANDYYTAVNTGWTIEGFIKHNKNVQKSSLFERLKDPNFPKINQLLSKYNSISEVPQDVLAEAIDIFFNEVLIGTEKTPERVKAQLQTFGRLLINTPDEEKAYFKDVLPALIAENRLPGLEAVKNSFATPQARQEWANGWTVEDYEKLLTTEDVYGEAMSQDDGVKAIASIVSEQNAETISNNHKEINAEAKEFFDKNAEALKTINEKNGQNLTEEEAELYLKSQYYTTVSSGEISGTAINTVIDELEKSDLLNTMNTDAYELPNYKEILKLVNKYVEENNNLPLPKDEVKNILNEATNGNYDIVANNKEAEFNPPKSQGVYAETFNNDLINKTPKVDTRRLEELTAQILSTEDKEDYRFTVTNPNRQFLTNKKIRELKENALTQGGTAIREYLKQTGESSLSFAKEVFTNFKNVGQQAQDWATNYLENAGVTVQKLFLNGIKNSTKGMTIATKTLGDNINNMDIKFSRRIEKVIEKNTPKV